MAETILVHVKRNDTVEEIRSYVENLAAPGTHVIFLVSYPLASWHAWFRDHWISVDDRRKAMLEGRGVIDRYRWDTQRILAEQKLSPCREALKQKGVETSVNLYTGGLKRALKEYHDNGACLFLAFPKNGKSTRRARWSPERRVLALQS